MTQKKVAAAKINRGVYAGSFDPVTYGHLDMAYHAGKVMTTVFMMVGVNAAKKPLFTPDERIQMIRDDIESVVIPRLHKEGLHCDFEVVAHSGLTAAFMKANKAPFYIRGLRLGTEFDQEYPVIQASVQEYKQFTPLFLSTTNPKLHHISSSMVREVERLGGISASKYVTPATAEKLKARITELGIRPQ